MLQHLFSRMITCLFCLFTSPLGLYAEENFLLLNGLTNEIFFELGSHTDERISPCSTFKIALSLMGFDAGILKDEQNPLWPYQEGYDDALEAWKAPQTPQSWMKYSCIWYSRRLAYELGPEKFQNYLALFEYGNQNLSGPFPAWILSSLQISPKEQVRFIQKMLLGKLPISSKALQLTKAILFVEELPEGWKLYGKTGWGGPVRDPNDPNLELGWFLGWVEKDHSFFPFAYTIQDKKIHLPQRIPRVKELLNLAKYNL